MNSEDNDRSNGVGHRVHLVLSSGGVKCLSYGGAIAALMEKGISFASVSGASAGSLVGAILCSKDGPRKLNEAVYGLDFNTFGADNSWAPALLQLVRSPFARFTDSRVSEVFRDIVGYDPTFEELETPFATFGVDIRTHKIHVYSKTTRPTMRVADALRISTAAPFMFPPQPEGENLLLDGALVSQSPVWLASAHDDGLPVIVLRPGKDVDDPSRRGFAEYVTGLIDLGGGSRDSLIIDEMPSARLVEIDCDTVRYDQFDLTQEERGDLVRSGRKAVESRGKDIDALLSGVPQLPRPRPAAGGEQKTVSVGEEAIRKMFTGLPPKRDQIFISYSHDDEEWLHKLQTALTPHIYNSAIKAWDDTHIPPGARWREEITRAIAAAKVAVLLVSMNFFASKFINDVEMQAFLRASEEDGLKILPVIVGPSIYEDWPPLKDIQTVNRLDRPLKGFENKAELDAEMVMISKEIKKALVPQEASALPNPEAATT
jgi:predicted acylesterase/phospholipase RssA